MKYLLLLFLFLLSILGIKAQSNLRENYHYSKLDNGLEVLIISDYSVPLINLEIAFRGGGIVEPPDLDGISHLYEHMIFNATEGYPTAKLFNDKMLELGIIMNAGTDQEIVNYYFTLPAENWTEGMGLFAQGILKPLFLEQELEKERLIVNDEFQRAESDPSFLIDRETDKKLWGDLFSRKNVIGDHDVILSASKDQLELLRSKYYHPNNAIMIVSGAINFSEALDQIKINFNDWKPSDYEPLGKNIIPDFKPLTKSEKFIIEDENSEESLLLYAWHGPDTRNDLKSVFAAEMFFNMLSLQNLGFQQNLVESGLAYETDSWSTSSKYVSSMYLEIYPNEKKITKTLASIEKEIDQWATPGYFSEKDLETAKNLFIINDAYDQEELSEYIHFIAGIWASADIDIAMSLQDKIQKVTMDDINNFINKYIVNKPRTVGIIIPPSLRKKIGSFE